MRRLMSFIGLEFYSFALAGVRHVGGVHTDEAKYLLNIPYPHPPLARWILHWTELIPFQELLWRIVFATLLIQAVFFVWDMARMRTREERFTLCGLWLFSTGAGTLFSVAAYAAGTRCTISRCSGIAMAR
jgi:hypothetical protein